MPSLTIESLFLYWYYLRLGGIWNGLALRENALQMSNE